MSDLGDAAARIGDKITELLDVFDLSFFMSGALSTAAILVMLPPSLPNPVRGDAVAGTAVFGLVLGSYVLGLLCFAVGRPLRGRVGLPTWRVIKRVEAFVRRKKSLPAVLEHERIRAALTAQKLQGAELRRYFGCHFDDAGEPELMALYTRMWVHVRSYPKLAESFTLLKRYWTFSAVYDGIAIAALLWLIPVWFRLGFDEPLYANPLLLTGLVGLVALSCWHRAQQYKNYQIEELVATVAHWMSMVGRQELDGAAPSDPSD